MSTRWPTSTPKSGRGGFKISVGTCTEKLEVNGVGRHPLYSQLTATPNADGKAGDIQWNFEKFLVSPEGTIGARFRPQTTPDSDEVVKAVESVLAA
jgi:glutathione peroxidase